MENSIDKINSKLNYSFIAAKYTAQILDKKVVYTVGGEFREVVFDSGLVYHRLNGKVNFLRSDNNQTLFNYPIRSVFVADINDCNPTNVLQKIALNAIKDVDSFELRTEAVKTDEGIEIPFGFYAIYVDYVITEAVSNKVLLINDCTDSIISEIGECLISENNEILIKE